jgi:hypothetical protein
MPDDRRQGRLEAEPEHADAEAERADPTKPGDVLPPGEEPVDAADPRQSRRHRRERIGSSGGGPYPPGTPAEDEPAPD